MILQAARNIYEAKNALHGPNQSLKFKDDTITLSIPQNGRMKNNWKVCPITPPKV